MQDRVQPNNGNEGCNDRANDNLDDMLDGTPHRTFIRANELSVFFFLCLFFLLSVFGYFYLNWQFEVWVRISKVVFA